MQNFLQTQKRINSFGVRMAITTLEFMYPVLFIPKLAHY